MIPVTDGRSRRKFRTNHLQSQGAVG